MVVSNMKKSYVLLLAITSSVLLLVYSFFEWPLTDFLTPFLAFPIWLALVGSFFSITIFSFVQLFLRKNWVPVLICVVAGFIWIKAPLIDWFLAADYSVFKEQRNEVVKQINNGTLKPSKDDEDLIHLPKKYLATSSGGGDVLLDKQKDGQYAVLFFTYRGMLSGYSGFAYIPGESTIAKKPFGSKVIEINKKDNHWYDISAE